MTRVLIWKEFREQAAVVIALTVLGCGVLVTMAVLNGRDESSSIRDIRNMTMAGRIGVIMLTMTAGLVIGGTLFAGERENGSFLYLDRLPGSRWRIWWRKILAGIAMDSVATICIVSAAMGLGLLGDRKEFSAWVVITFMLAAFSFGWGAVGSVHSKTSLAACGLGMVYAVAFLLLCVLLTMIGMQLFYLVFPDQRDLFRGPLTTLPALLPTFTTLVSPLPISAWLFTAPDRDRLYGTMLSLPTPGGGVRTPRVPFSVAFLAPKGWFTKTRRMLWLMLRQHWVTAIVLSVMSLIMGCTMLIEGSVFIYVWPAISLLMGVLVGVTSLSDEQGSEAARFWGERRLPVGRVWRTKILTGFGMLFGFLLLMFLPVLFKSLVAIGDDRYGPRIFAAMNTRVLAYPEFPHFSFLFLWPVYGFTFGHIAAMLFRKGLVAGAVGIMLAGMFSVMWLPSLFSGGIHTWQIWSPIFVALVTARMLMWSWATNAISTRRALRRLIIGGVCMIGTIGFGIAYRVLEVPVIPEIEDDIRYSESLPSFDEKQAGRDLRRAASVFREVENRELTSYTFNRLIHDDPSWEQHERQYRLRPLEQLASTLKVGYPADRPDVDKLLEMYSKTNWEEFLKEAATKPTGVMDDPNEMTADTIMPNLEEMRKIMIVYLVGGLKEQAHGNPAAFVERLEVWLAAIRTIKNKSVLMSVRMASAFEVFTFQAFDQWLSRLEGHPELLKRALAAIRYHHEKEPYDPHNTLMADQTVIRQSVHAPTQWLPRYFDQYVSRQSSISTEAQADAETVALMWAVPWERERLRRVVGMTNDYNNAQEQREFLQGIPAQRLLANTGPGHVSVCQTEDQRCRTWQSLAILSIALRLYHLDNGQFPQKLNQLVPKYLDKLPDDAYLHPAAVNKSFGYRIAQPGEQIRVNTNIAKYMIDPDLLNVGSEKPIEMARGVSALCGSIVLWGRPDGFFDPLNTPCDDPNELARGVSTIVGGAALHELNNGFMDDEMVMQSQGGTSGGFTLPGGPGSMGGGVGGMPAGVTAGMGGGMGMGSGSMQIPTGMSSSTSNPNPVGTLGRVPAPNQLDVTPGDAVLWSTGPDRRDDGGTLAYELGGGSSFGDIIVIVKPPLKPKPQPATMTGDKKP